MPLRSLPLESRPPAIANPAICPDCPASRATGLSDLLPGKGGPCAFRCAPLHRHELLPQRWFAYGFGLVRRGVLIRQRVDAQGRASAIDAVGPGAFFPLDPGPHAPSRLRDVTGYAATDVMVCLCPSDTMSTSIDAHGLAARDLLHLHREALDRVERIADARARSTAAGRVAALLLALADTLHGDSPCGALHADLQQRDLAALVSLRHESVCRALGHFAACGWISHGADGLRILDRAQLAAL